MNDNLKYVKHGQIERGENPRKFFDPVAMSKLKGSIREHGVRRNLEVEEIGEGHFRLVTGEPRWRATGELLEDLSGEIG